MRAVGAMVILAVSLVVLELARVDVEIDRFQVGETPVTRYAQLKATGPAVVIAHGFAGSEQMMQGYALPLARAGYRVFAFDTLGHGKHPRPMSGDVTSVDGTTKLLVDQTHSVIDAVDSMGKDVALIGHSMATDILVRTAETREGIGPMVLISAFSQRIDATKPETLLMISGAWEGGLRAFGLEAAQMVDAIAQEGETARAGQIMRKAVAAPFSEHVSVLQSRVARAETVAWLDTVYKRQSNVRILPSGWAILGLLGGLVLVFPSVLQRISKTATTYPSLNRMQFMMVILGPAVVAPLIAVPLNPSFLPVLVADYLGLHLLIYGTLQLALLWRWGIKPAGWSLPVCATLLIWCVLFGAGLDRYAANFIPTSQRLWIIAILMCGAVPYMLADALLTTASSLWRRLLVRTGFLASLGIAVALDFDGLFFIVMIAPVLVLFYLAFGTMGRMASQRSGPLVSGVVLGVVLAWALGVSFPLFQA